MDGSVERPRRQATSSGLVGTRVGAVRGSTRRSRPLVTALLAVIALVSAAVLTGSVASAMTPRLKKPSAPIGVVAHPIEQGAVVSWGVPVSDGGSPITGYTVTVGSGAKRVTCSTVTQLTCTITGLMNGRRHTATVRAVNALGAGRPGRSARFVSGQSPDCSNFTPGADLQYCDFHGATLSGLDLAGADLWGAKLFDATFVNCNLSGAIFGGDTGAQAQLTDAWFNNDDMVGVQFEDLYIYATNFESGTNLSNANFFNSIVLADSFDSVNLTGADLTGALVQFPTFSATTCPDGTNSDNDGGTCLNDL
jgi:Pentapeptide repeats (8 copies)/Fibronectin type III domain